MSHPIVSIARIGPQRMSRKPSERTYEDVYRIETNSWSADAETLGNLVIAHPRVPAAWPTYPTARLQDVELEQVASARKFWDARLTWSTASSSVEEVSRPRRPRTRS